MTPIEFIIWLKGFAQAANGFNVTPKQWDDIKEQLDRVNLQESTGPAAYPLESTSATAKILLRTEPNY